jgi:hypothetical protein
VKPEITSILYRFRPWSVLKPEAPERKYITEIEERVAWFSTPTELNDVQDNLLGPEFTGGTSDTERLFFHALANPLRLARQNKCNVTALDSNNPEVQNLQREDKRREMRKQSRVRCFSWDWSSPLLWTFYAQEHQGFCLGYSTDGELLRRARPVLYTHFPTDVCHLEDPVTGNDQLSFCKSPDWQFEKEWRVCLPDPGLKRVELKNEKLVSVHIGYRMKHPQLQELIAMLQKGGYKPDETKLFRVERLHMSFVLCQRPIDWKID